jgi:nitrite reductase/ring-hydroxylating ferredoxin subunit
MTITLCSTSDIPDPGSKAFEINHHGNNLAIFVVHKDGQFHAFINRCPHTGVNLEWLEDQFLDRDNAYIQCVSHDALFEIDTGHCVHGPCAGDNLPPVQLDVIDNQLVANLQNID